MSIQKRLDDIHAFFDYYTAGNEEEFVLVQSAQALLTAIKAVTALADKPDIITHHPKGDKTFYIEAHRIRSAVEKQLRRSE